MIKVLGTVLPKILVIEAAVANVAEAFGIIAVVTVGKNGKHMEGSLHYEYKALDVRSKNIPKEDRALFLKHVMERLGERYQGFLEDKGTPNEHFHIEYDPS